MSVSYEIAIEEDSILVRMPTNLFSREEIMRFLDYLEVESIRRRSQLTRADAERFADEIDRAGWSQMQERTGGRLIPASFVSEAQKLCAAIDTTTRYT